MAAWRYDGAPLPHRLRPIEATVLHAGLHLRRLAQPRALWPYLLIAVAVSAGGLGLVKLALSDPSAPIEYFRKFLLRAVALSALGLASAAVRTDADAGALQYWLLRPRAALALPVGRWLAVVVAVTGLGWLMSLAVLGATAGTILMPPGEFIVRMLLSIPLAALVYSAIFLLIASTVRAAAATGLLWLVIVDLALASLSTTVGIVAPSQYLGTFIAGAPDASLIDTLKAKVGAAAGLATAATATATWQHVAGAAAGLVLLTGAALGGVVLRFRGNPPD